MRLPVAVVAVLVASPAGATSDAVPPLAEETFREPGGTTVRLLAGAGSPLGAGGPELLAGGAAAVDFWQADRSTAMRLGAELGRYGTALEAGGVLAAEGDARPYLVLTVGLASLEGGAGVSMLLGAGLEVTIAGRLVLCIEARLRGVAGEEQDDGTTVDGASAFSALAGVGWTF